MRVFHDKPIDEFGTMDDTTFRKRLVSAVLANDLDLLNRACQYIENMAGQNPEKAKKLMHFQMPTGQTLMALALDKGCPEEIIQCLLEMAAITINRETAIEKGFSSSVSEIPMGLHLQEIIGDGSCLYRAVSSSLGCEWDVASLRWAVANKISSHRDQYRGFVTLPEGETLDQYIADIRGTNAWAGNLEINALMHVLERPIVVIGPAGEIRNQQEVDMFEGEPIFVRFNNENHYDALKLDFPDRGRDVLADLKRAPKQQRNQVPNINPDFVVTRTEKPSIRKPVDTPGFLIDLTVDEPASKKPKMSSYFPMWGERYSSSPQKGVQFVPLFTMPEVREKLINLRPIYSGGCVEEKTRRPLSTLTSTSSSSSSPDLTQIGKTPSLKGCIKREEKPTETKKARGVSFGQK